MAKYLPLLLVLPGLVLLPAVARGAPKPGDVVTADNIADAGDMISPGVQWCVKHGMTIRVVAAQSIDLPKPYLEATEKYASQVQLAADGLKLKHYVAGLPFPTIDPNDPQAALKIMWNYEYKPYVTDDGDARNFDADTGSIGTTGPMDIERHFLVDHIRTLNYNGRVFNDPKPELPNTDGVRYKSSLQPVLEPFDLKGVGSLTIRYIDPARQDDTWLYLPTLRRVRRLSSAQRSDALFGQDTDVDSYGGYAGQIAWMDWKFLGERKILAPFHAHHFPVQWCPAPGDFAFCDNWEPRDAYVIQGISKLPQYAYGSRLLFIDKDTYLVAFSDITDHEGRLWKVWINDWSFRRKAFPNAQYTYDTPFPFGPSIVMADVQLQHVTKAALPSLAYPGEEGWFFNRGAAVGDTADFFTVAHMIEAAH
ncbi:MAG TPA: DUF1329 domain-containing protein [Candidatus Kryptonia bacterium]|nr:DUF1329 domain-containing protein [Candidatus Kryptonia bacterium]